MYEFAISCLLFVLNILEFMIQNTISSRLTMKGIILAGGSGTRLYPATLAISKQLIPVYDKPMIYYPLSTLMLAGIREIMIISTPHDLPNFEKLLGSGEQFGVQFHYSKQLKPEGLAQAFLIAEEFLNNEPACLILGDNIFYGNRFPLTLEAAYKRQKGATIFGYYVNDPERYGVAEFDKNQTVIGIEEKPQNPKSHYAITGLYFYDHRVCEFAKQVKPSRRGELEITDLNKIYLEDKTLKLEILGRGTTWLDTGTHDSLIDASHFISVIQNRQGLKVCCPEEIAYLKKWISQDQLREQATTLAKNDYGQYLLKLLDNKL